MLNAVRFYEIGIPLSYVQYAQLSPSHLVSRLLARNLHLLALRISSYLALPPDAVAPEPDYAYADVCHCPSTTADGLVLWAATPAFEGAFSCYYGDEEESAICAYDEEVRALV